MFLARESLPPSCAFVYWRDTVVRALPSVVYRLCMCVDRDYLINCTCKGDINTKVIQSSALCIPKSSSMPAFLKFL
jgi:hypothetical protein